MKKEINLLLNRSKIIQVPGINILSLVHKFLSQIPRETYF